MVFFYAIYEVCIILPLALVATILTSAVTAITDNNAEKINIPQKYGMKSPSFNS